MNHLCAERIPCGESLVPPVINYSSEQPDSEIFVATVHWVIDPPLGTSWIAVGCLGVCTSNMSQEDADQCALRQAIFCVEDNGGGPVTPPCPTCPDNPPNPCVPGDPCSGNGGGCMTEDCTPQQPPLPVFCNEPQTCAVQCPDGSPFSFTTRAGMFCSHSQVLSNNQAFAYACNQALGRRICISTPTNECCVNANCSFGLTVFGGVNPLNWELISGSLPPGMVDTNSIDGRTLTISGIPTVPGNYVVVYRVTDALGHFMQKEFTLPILGILTDTPLNGFTDNILYSNQLSAAGGVGPYVFGIVQGALPPGMTLSPSGEISGVSSSVVDAIFTVSVTDSTGKVCTKGFVLPWRGAPPFTCPSVKSQINISGNIFGGVVLEAVTGKLFYPSYLNQNIYRFDPATNTEDANMGAGTFYPSAMVDVNNISATRHTTAPFTVPGVGLNVSIQVDSTRLLSAGVAITINTKNYSVVSITDETNMVVKNLGDTPTTIVGSGALIQVTISLLLASGDDLGITTGQVYKLDPLTLVPEFLFNLSSTTSTSTNIAYATATNRLFIGTSTGLDVIDIATGTRTSIAVASTVLGLAYSAAHGKVYAYKTSQFIDEIDEHTLATTRTVQITGDPSGSSIFNTNICLAYSPVSDHIYASAGTSAVGPTLQINRVAIFSASSFLQLQIIQLSNEDHGGLSRGPCLTYDPDAGTMYCSYTTVDNVKHTKIIKTSTDTVVCTINLVGLESGVKVPSKGSVYGWQPGTTQQMIEMG